LQFIKSHFEELGWSIGEDQFTDNTPLGAKEFRNLIVTLNPNACKHLVFACHYDSKYFKNGKFLGATDSAVPCAMLMTMASDLDQLLKIQRHSNPTAPSLQFIFFDGEEAFVEWSDTDSLYGSRHLADMLNRTPVAPGICDKSVVSEIDRMDLFVLLDLLGAAKPSFYSFFPDTDVYYARMLTIESDLNSARLMRSATSNKGTSFFKNRRSFGMIEDDHIPFMRKGVKILHLITSPFPSVWHKLSDDASALHHPTICDLIAIFKSFVAEYLHLNVATL
jgi:glutaminyl-peptide cyclotransferase